MSSTSVITVEGRDVAFAQWGPDEGSALFCLPGTPGSRQFRHVGGEYERVGTRVITVDRPGYGRSSRFPGHSVAEAARDLGAIADHLGLDRFTVLGISGGGPYALAAAGALQGRVTRCATIVGLAPYDAEGLNFCAGMDDETREEWRQAVEGEATMVAEGYPAALQWIHFLAEDRDLPAHIREMLVETFTEAFRSGPGGMVDDYLALIKPWGADLRDVTCPTRVVIARDDTTVPPAHGHWLATHLPDAETVLVDGGHMGPREDAEEAVLDWLAA